MNIKKALQQANAKLTKHSQSPHLDSEVLLSFVLSKTREYLLTNPETKISSHKYKKFIKYIPKFGYYI